MPTPAQLARLAEVQVVVSADTLTGASDLPAHIPGIGPVEVGTVRDLAARARWRRLVADPDTGTLVHADDRVLPPPPRDTDTTHAPTTSTDARLERLLTDPVTPARLDDGSRYRPSPALRRHVRTRDATCIGPACFHPATSTQVDHTINHGERDEHGVLGTTSAGNLGSTCERVLGRQDPRRLATTTTRTRHVRLDQPHRPQLRQPDEHPSQTGGYGTSAPCFAPPAALS